MKTRFLTVALVGLIATFAKADYLLWNVDTNKSGVNAYALYSGSYSTGTFITYQTVSDGQSTVTFDFTSSNSLNYYVELWNYDSSTGKATASYYSDSVGYQTLVDASALKVSTTILNPSSLIPYSGTYHAVPEPTSGLLVLMGFAVLGLKRKKI